MASHSNPGSGLTPREIAQQHRSQELKRERTRRAVIGGAILAALVAVVIIVSVIFKKNAASVSSTGKGPAPAYANKSGGVKIIKGGHLEKAGGFEADADSVGAPAAASDTNKPSGLVATKPGEAGQVVIYLDMLCPYCGEFEKANGEYIKKMIDDGKITAEYRIISILDTPSNTNYPSRAGGALMAVADAYPDKFLTAMQALFASQPGEQFGAKDQHIKEVLVGAGVPAEIEQKVDNKEFRSFVKYTNAVAAKEGVQGTPSIYIEGKKWDQKAQPDFKKALEAALAARK